MISLITITPHSSPSKTELLRKLCTDGLALVAAETETAIEQVKAGLDHWQVFSGFMRNLVDADTTAMTLALAGRFTPTPDMKDRDELPGPPPAWPELSERWIPAAAPS